MQENHILDDDIRVILEKADKAFVKLQGKHIFITGATGFFGKWLLESIHRYNCENQQNKLDVTILSRDPKSFLDTYPHLNSIRTVQGDVRDLSHIRGHYDYLIHAATPASDHLNQTNPLKMFELIVDGARSVMEFAARVGVRRILHTSSGAVYGPQPAHMRYIGEDFFGGPDTMKCSSAYGEGKRNAEFFLNTSGRQSHIEVVHARCFCFAGAFLPLDTHFAFGNFIRDAVSLKPSVLSGDGTPIRSYLYAADLVVWLLHILVYARPFEAYNVGSEEEVSIAELAQLVQKVSKCNQGVVLGKQVGSGLRNRYVPSIQKAKVELGLAPFTDIQSMIIKMHKWAHYELHRHIQNNVAVDLSL